MRVSNRLLLAASVATMATSLGASLPAFASGFALREMTADQTAHAFAGGVSQASDPSTAYGNPAGMAHVDGVQMQFDVNGIFPSATFSGSNTLGGVTSTGTTGNVVQSAATGGLAIVAPASDKVNLGLAIATPYGQRVSNPQNFVGNYQSLVSSITDVSVSLAASLKVNEQLSVGGGPVIDLFEARLTQGLNMSALLGSPSVLNNVAAGAALNAAGTTTGDMHGTDTGIGFNIGAMYQFDDKTRVGLDYRSQIEHSITGTQTITPSAAIRNFTSGGLPVGLLIASQIAAGSSAASTKVTLPDSITLGITREITPQLTLMAEAQWTDWSLLKTIVVNTGSAATSSSLTENWRNTYYIGVGADYKLNEKLTLKGGLGYDQSPVTFSNRTSRIPDGDRVIVGIGAGYAFTPAIRGEFGYAHLFVGSQGINNSSGASAGTLVGKYNDTADSFGLSLTIKL